MPRDLLAVSLPSRQPRDLFALSPRREPIKLESAKFQKPLDISNPVVAAVKAASEFVPGTQFATIREP